MLEPVSIYQKVNNLAELSKAIADGFDVNGVSFDGSILHLAVKKDLPESVKLLLNKNADPNTRNAYGMTPLFIACAKGSYKMAKLLIDAGARVNIRDWEDGTPLHSAVHNKHADVVKLLLESNADKGAKDNHGNDIMIMDTSTEVREVLNA